MAKNQFNVGVQLGLDRDENLAARCAEFYMLELLESKMFERREAQVEINGQLQTRMRLTDIPLHHTRDSRKEMLAYRTKLTLAHLEKKIAEQFRIYMTIACGGELRHLHRFNLSAAKSVDCSHTQHNPKCYTPCINRFSEFAKELYPTQNLDTRAKAVRFMQKVGRMGQFFWHGAACPCMCPHVKTKTHRTKCITKRSYVVSPRIQEYLDEVHHAYDNYGSNGSRAEGWDVWWRMHLENPAQWMYDCADAFDLGVWGGGGFGGPKWATAARLTADYLAGKVSTRMYIDRGWSLQHNGGSLFNKFFRTSATDWGDDLLMMTLEKQAENNYDFLAWIVATEPVSQLWADYLREYEGEEVTSIFARASEIKKQAIEEARPDHDPDDYCASCWEYLQESGNAHPCGYGDIDSSNTGCAYYEHADCVCDDCQPELSVYNGDGCMYCHAWAEHNGEDDPCGQELGIMKGSVHCMHKSWYEQMEAEMKEAELMDEEDVIVLT